MRDQEQGMEKVSGGGGGGGRRRKGGLSIPMTGGCGVVGVAILVFAAAAAAVGASVVARARRARREDRTTKRSFADDVDNERIEGVKEEVEEEEENDSIISQRREKMVQETEEISFQIDQENRFIEKLNLSPRREDMEIIAATDEEEIILKAGNNGDYDRESSEGSQAAPIDVKVSEETNDEKEGDRKQEEEEDSTEDEKAECDPSSSSVEFGATMEPSTGEAVDGSNDDSRACLTESGVFVAAAEAIENASKTTEENDFSAKEREVEWKLEEDVNKDQRGEPEKIEIRNTAKKTIAIEENEIGFAIANRSKGGLLMISAFVLAIVLLLFVRRDRPGVSELSTM